MANTRPDLIIAIDLGMTCKCVSMSFCAIVTLLKLRLWGRAKILTSTGTGVAYVNQSIGSDTIRWIQKWPGRQQSNENKVSLDHFLFRSYC